MAETIETDICVIGAGSAGLTIAAGASQMGARVVLCERGKMGGDCLNYGCVPSKALIAAAKHAHAIESGRRFGVHAGPPTIDFQRVHDHVHEVIAAIEPNDSQERFEALGVHVIRADAKFINGNEIEAGGHRIQAKRFVVATGSRAAVPPIPGLDQVPYLTNETLFDNTTRPDELIIIGGGPIGIEMAQAHHRLGSKVVVLEAARVLSNDDPEMAGLIRDHLMKDGVTIREGAKVTSVARTDAGEIAVALEGGERVLGSHLLLATGRAANVDTLNLEAANVQYDQRGVKTDAKLRSISNKRIYAAGDVAGRLQFTHVAGYHASTVIKNVLFWLPSKADESAVPWVTYTDPELAHVGMTEAEARRKIGSKINILRWPLAENDRAQAERRDDGLIKVVTTSGGKILGASIVAPHAGDLLQPWILAVGNKMKIGSMANLVAAYPTFSEISKRAAGSYYTPTLFSDRTRSIVRFLLRWT